MSTNVYVETIKMTVDEVEAYFGCGARACEAIGRSRQSFTNWRARGYIPLLQQYRLQEYTEGALRADCAHVPPRKKITQKHGKK